MAQASNKSYPYDAELRLHDGTALTSDGAGSDGILDLGAAGWEGLLVTQLTALDVANGDEAYRWQLQGSTSSTFASGIVVLGEQLFGDAAATPESADTATGVPYAIPVANQKGGTVYRYVRLYADVTGTSPSITATAYLSARP